MDDGEQAEGEVLASDGHSVGSVFCKYTVVVAGHSLQGYASDYELQTQLLHLFSILASGCTEDGCYIRSDVPLSVSGGSEIELTSPCFTSSQ